MSDRQEKFWWEREGLAYDRAGVLHLEGEALAALAAASGTPLYIYSARRIRQNLDRLHGALQRKVPRHRIFYAMKSNRFLPVLTLLKTLGACGIDACSPDELMLARQVGFTEEEISFTGTSVSDNDLRRVCLHPDVWINCDSLSSIRRLAAIAPGRSIGIRINPAIGVGYGSNELLRYSGAKPTKFGVYRDRFDEALAQAADYGLRVNGIHVHSGCGYLNGQLEAFERVMEATAWFIERTPGLQYVNVGGGLGIPLTQEDPTLDLEAWADILHRRFAGADFEVWVEPGDYIVKDAGVLVLQANTVERKGETVFVGVDGGFNIHVEPAFYRLPLHVVPCRLCGSQEPWNRRVTVAGNINEALDLLAEDVDLPEVAEGDFLAFLNAGGYGSSMSSNHCMRGTFREFLVH